MTVSVPADRTDGESVPRLHKPGVAGSSPAAANPSDSVTICHTEAAIYHGWPEVSASQLKALAHSPVEFYARFVGGEVGFRSSAAMEYGTLLHLWGEVGEEKFWSLAKRYPSEVLTATGLLGKDAKAWAAEQPEGSILVTPSDWTKLYDQTRQILANTAARSLLESAVDKEFNVRFEWAGHRCRCRCDGATEQVWYDLKTTREADPRREAWKAVSAFFYDIQAALYCEAAVQAGWPSHRMQFIFTSTVAPYLCCVAVLPPEVMQKGRTRCLKLLAELQQRREWNHWLPDDYGEVVELACPNWMKGGE